MKSFTGAKSQDLRIVLYGLTAIVLITAFQVYWIYTVFENQRKQIVKDSENILKTYTVNYDGFFVTNNFSSVSMPNGMVRQILTTPGIHTAVRIEASPGAKDSEMKTVLDSMFSSEMMTDAQVALLDDISNEMAEKYSGLVFRIRYPQDNGTTVYPDSLAGAKAAAVTSRIYSSINPYLYYKLEFMNLKAVVLGNIIIPILISVAYLIVCVSAVFLLVNSIRKSRRLIEMKDNFTNNMTHELKTPLSTLLIAAEALEKYNVVDDRNAAREYIQIMQADLKRMAGMAESILYNARLSQGKIHLNATRLNLRQVLENLIVNFVPRLNILNAKIITDVAHNIFIHADEEHITNVFSNLIDNSLKYCIHAPEISITANTERDAVQIYFADNGIGISAENQKEIFKPYYRVSEGDQHNVKGYGLGLSYSYEIVLLHGGSLKIFRSEPSNGTTVELILPSDNGSD